MGSHDPFGHLKHKLRLKEGPLKVGNHLNFLTCKWCVTYRWKTFNEGYNFVMDLISIGGLHIKLWAPKVVGIPTMGISRIPAVGISGFALGSPGTK